MKRSSLSIACLLFTVLCTTSIKAQSPIKYSVDLENCHHHELHISVTFPALPQKILSVRMPSASPGRYAIHHFAKNVYDVKAYDSKGKALEAIRNAPEQWLIAGHDGMVRFDYILYANHGDGTYSGVDNRKLHLNMPATFVYAENMEERPIELSFNLGDKDWRAATQLEQLEATKFRAPNYYYFLDSPVIVGDIQKKQWKSKSNGKEYTFEIAMLHEGTEEELDNYVEWTKKIVEEQKAVYGTLPDFDFGKYTFLLSYNPWVHGDGMEHRNSTICTSKGNLEDNASQLIGTVSHEFFHAWNVERIRPKSLEPFDFDHANMSGELWFAEGFTSYYDDLILCRTGIISKEQYAKGLSQQLTYVLNYPGRQYRNPIEMSYHAPFTDAASSIDEHNTQNTFISYYSYGAVIGMCLDLSIRSEFKKKSLDDVMRYLWEKYGVPEIPYEIPDLQAAVATVTGDATFAAEFFSNYIYQSKLPDLKSLLLDFGIVLDYKSPGKVGFLDGSMEKEENGFVLKSVTLKGMPLYEAGLNKGDKILAIAGKEVAALESLKELITTLEIGKSYPIVFEQNGLIVNSKITMKQHPLLKCQLAEEAAYKVKNKTEKKRKAWLKQ